MEEYLCTPWKCPGSTCFKRFSSASFRCRSRCSLPKLGSTKIKEMISGTFLELLQVPKGKASSPADLGFLPFASFHSCLSLENREWFQSKLVFFPELRTKKTNQFQRKTSLKLLWMRYIMMYLIICIVIELCTLYMHLFVCSAPVRLHTQMHLYMYRKMYIYIYICTHTHTFYNEWQRYVCVPKKYQNFLESKRIPPWSAFCDPSRVLKTEDWCEQSPTLGVILLHLQLNNVPCTASQLAKPCYSISHTEAKMTGWCVGEITVCQSQHLQRNSVEACDQSPINIMNLNFLTLNEPK